MTLDERAVVALERIAAALEVQNAMLNPENAPEHVCGHPEDKREDFSTMGNPRWRCTECGFKAGFDEGAAT
jgi:transposase-like protein